MTNYSGIHAHAVVEEGATIGKRVRILPFAHIRSGVIVGDDCFIASHALLEQGAQLGKHVTIEHGAHVGHYVALEDDVHVGPNTTLTGRGTRTSSDLSTLVKRGACIEANVCIHAGVIVSNNARVQSGSVVTRDVPPNAIVSGNPALITGYINAVSDERSMPEAQLHRELVNLPARGCTLRAFRIINDIRGNLTFAEMYKGLPFTPKRYFLVFGVPNGEVRGEHAHKTCHQFLVCAAGAVNVVLDDGENRCDITLNAPNVGLHIPPGIWGIQYKYSRDAVLLVLASDVYDGEDYIRNYEEFRRYARSTT